MNTSVRHTLSSKAKSGTGKTLVYILTALYGIDPSKARLQALVLAPTREIAVQGARAALDVGAAIPELKVSTFIGGTSVEVRCKRSL